jgi:hypothetical protein
MTVYGIVNQDVVVSDGVFHLTKRLGAEGRRDYRRALICSSSSEQR